MYKLCFQGQPLHTATTWHEVADHALAHGLATRIFGCIFYLLPGVSIHA